MDLRISCASGKLKRVFPALNSSEAAACSLQKACKKLRNVAIEMTSSLELNNANLAKFKAAEFTQFSTDSGSDVVHIHTCLSSGGSRTKRN
jgi:hypothetical protein